MSLAARGLPERLRFDGREKPRRLGAEGSARLAETISDDPVPRRRRARDRGDVSRGRQGRRDVDGAPREKAALGDRRKAAGRQLPLRKELVQPHAAEPVERDDHSAP